MKKQSVIIISAVSLFCSAFSLAMIWKADEKTSTINWELGGAEKKGTFSNLISSIDFDKSNLSESKITASIDVKTLKAGNEGLEKHLLSPDFFDAEKFPKISFNSKEIIADGTSYIAKGTLTMKDSTKAIDIPFTFIEESGNKAVFNGTMTVNPNQFGVTKVKADGTGGVDYVVIFLTVPVTK